MIRSFLLAILLVALASCNHIQRTNQGSVMGVMGPYATSFYGVPYAAPPVGDLRWRSPRTALNYTGDMYDATMPGYICPQSRLPGASPLDYPQSEDCLNLNIYVPLYPNGTNTTLLYPVRVFIHGGSYISGAGIVYGGAELANQSNTIIVTINYRLGIFGWGVFSGTVYSQNETLNFGYQDQQLALIWLRQNIGYFGGDPDNVMLTGESVGGISTLFHLTTPSSWPYFSKIVCQSPGYFTWPLPANLAMYNDMVLNRSLSSLGCSNVSDIACFRTLSWDSLYQLPLVNLAVLDNRMMSDQLLNSLANGNYKLNTPIIIGVNKDEATALIDAGATPQYFALWLRSIFKVNESVIQQIESAYGIDLDTSNSTAFVEDYAIKIGATAAAYAIASRQSNIWFYNFVHVPRNSLFTPFGATHMAELPYVFANQAFMNTTFDADEYLLSSRLIAYWTNFHRYGNPNMEGSAWWPSLFNGTTSSANGIWWQVLDINPYAVAFNISSRYPYLAPILAGRNEIPPITSGSSIIGSSSIGSMMSSGSQGLTSVISTNGLTTVVNSNVRTTFTFTYDESPASTAIVSLALLCAALLL